MESIVIACAIVLVVANVVVSIAILRCEFYAPFQKVAQCAIVWLAPILGAIGIWTFLRVQYNWQKYDTRAYPEGSQKMVAVAINDSILDSFGSGDGGGGDGGD